MAKRTKIEGPTLQESRFVIGLSAMTLLLFFGWTFYMRYYFQFPSTLDDPLVPPYFKRVEDAMPFPDTLDPLRFPAGELREAYAIAKEVPEVLAQQPCYCQRPVMHSLLDCFATLEAANCKICVDEAHLAARLRQQGETGPEIRAAIVRQFGVVSVRGRR